MWSIRTKPARGRKFNRGAQLLAAALEQRGWSQTRLKNELGTTQAVSNWLYGDRRPSLEWAVKLRDLLGIPVEAWNQPANDVESALAATGTEG